MSQSSDSNKPNGVKPNSNPPAAVKPQQDQLSAEQKRELLAKLLKQKQQSTQPAPRRFVLTPAQKRLWFIDQLQPGNTAYNMPFAIRLQGDIAVDLLQGCLNDLLERHEILRTAFVDDEGQPWQQVQPTLGLPLDYATNITINNADSAIELEQALRPSLQQLVAQPFDLSKPPLLRARLFKLADQDYVLAIVMHHIIMDFTSLDIMMREILAFYHARLQNQAPQLPALSIQYADYAHWLDQQQAQHRQDRDYWCEQLAGAPELLALPTDFTRPARQRFVGERVSFTISTSCFQGLKALAQQQQATPFMAALAAFQVLLYRYSNEHDICVGSTISNRERAELRPLVGMFVNTLVLRSVCTGHESFVEFLQQVKQTALAAYKHQSAPFEEVVDALDIERDVSYNALFQVMFNLHTQQPQRLAMPGLELSAVEFTHRVSRFDLSLDIYEQADSAGKPGEARAFFEFNVDLFKRETIERMVGHFQNLLESIVANSQIAIADLPLLEEKNRDQVLVRTQEWRRLASDTPWIHPCRLVKKVPLFDGPKQATSIPSDNVPTSEGKKAEKFRQCCSVHNLIEQQVIATPHNVALQCGSKNWTYSELNEQANQIAHYLREQQTSTGERVGVCLPATPEALIAILAIIKSGAAYVPMDSRYPAGRLQHMATDAQLKTIITSSAYQQLFSELNQLELLLTDTDSTPWQHYTRDNPPSVSQPDDVLYMVYTSGSTGKPKGAGVTHGNELNLLQWYTREYSMTQSDRTLIASALGFDLTQKNLFALLSVGGTVVFPSTTDYEPLQLVKDIKAQQVTLLNMAPSAFYPLLEAGQDNHWDTLASLRCLLLGGEPIQLARLKPWLEHSGCALVNMYGPTECTDIATAYTLKAIDLTRVDSTPEQFTVPIGSACDNVELYVLSPDGCEPVPPGLPGELCIGGASVGCGYFNQTALTEAVFIDHPFLDSDENTQRDFKETIYRTGDLVKQRADGLLEFVRRKDSQLKVRGLRIEAGEIEAQLEEQTSITRAAVTQWQDHRNDQQLVAYCVPNDKALLDDQQQVQQLDLIKRSLADHLPAYMIPAVIVWLEELPLNANGKLDRRRLPEPDFSTSANTVFESPKTSTESLLADIWLEVLELDSLSRFDNFFNIGGHSILAARVIARLQPTFEVTVPMIDLFERPVLKDFAQLIDQTIDGERDDIAAQVEIPVLDRTDDKQSLPLSYAQQRQWALAQLEPDNPFYNMPGAVTIRGDLNRERLQQCFEYLGNRQEVLRTRILSVNGIAQLDILEQCAVSIDYQDLSSTPDIAKHRLITAARQPFDLSEAPLYRVHLFKTGDAEHILLVVLHHIIGDALSNEVLMRELLTLYQQLSKGQPADLPPLRLQYADFAAWQRSLNTDQQLKYWQDQLAEAPPLLELPTDYIRPATQRFDGGSVRFALNPQQTRALRELSSQQDATLFMTLLAAFKVLLARYSGMNDILVGIPTANRPHRELEQVIGMFLNTLTLRTQLNPQESFTSLIDKVRHTALAAYNHQDVPFEHVVDGLDLPRNWSHNPLFQVMFVWKTHGNLNIDTVDGLSWEPMVLEDNTAKVDLALIMNDGIDTLNGKLEFRTDLFRRDTIVAMKDVFIALLDAIVVEPQRPALSLPLMPDSQAAQIAAWNATERTWPKVCLHQLIEQQVQRTPDSAAISDATQSLRYDELLQRTTVLTAELQARQIGQGDRVGILMDRRCDMVTAIIATLRAGATYVPLDPNYPVDRIRYISEHAQLSAVFTESRYAEHSEATTAIYVDQINFHHTASLNPVTTSTSDLAYIIYTSGSTGRPKGVAIEHHSAVTLVQWAQQVFDSQQLQGMLASTSICFDLSVFEIFVTLSSGGQIILADNLFHLPEHPARDQVTLINTVPTAAAELLRLQAIPNSVSTVNLAGEAIPPILIDRLYAQPMVQHVYNLYGPSEDTSYSTFTRLTAQDAGEQSQRSAISIGVPIANTKAYLLDKDFSEVPIGMPGELYLAGYGLARGYWNAPELTAERFIHNPLSNLNDYTRLYKTGDRVRRRADGQLEFLGRIDNQVKLRGFRIELGEIEATLLDHQAITQAAVVVRTVDNGSQQLLAYVVTELAEETLKSILAAYLKQQLPDYMVPARYIKLQQLPLLPNGKINRNALPEPVSPEPSSEPSQDKISHAIRSAAFNDTESLIASVWSQVLKRDSLQSDDNFFALGGDSILAIQVIALLREQGLQFSPRDLFQYPTIGELASIASSKALINADQSRVVGPVPMLPIQQWFFEQPLQHRHHWNQTLLLKSEQALDTDKLAAALQQLQIHHDALRASFPFSSPQSETQSAQQVYLDTHTAVPLTVIKTCTDNCAAYIEQQAQSLQSQFDLQTGPLWRCVYFELDTATGTQYRLLLTAHHLLIDGVSWRTLLKDLQSLYQHTGSLPAKTTSIKNWAIKLEQAIANQQFATEVDYWETTANTSCVSFAKQLTFSDTDNRMADVSSVSVYLGETQTAQLLNDVPQHYKAKINDLLLAALLLTAESITGQRQLKLQMESHGRPDLFNDIDLSATIGWFTALYPVALQVDNALDTGEVLKAIKRQLRDIPNDGIGYGLLRYGIDGKGMDGKQQAPISDGLAEADLRFNYLGQTDRALGDDAMLQPAPESTGPALSPLDCRDVLLDVNALIANGRLRVQWQYSSALHRQDDIQRVADTYIEQLQLLIDFCLSEDTDSGLIAADFSLMDLEDDEMDDLLGSL